MMRVPFTKMNGCGNDYVFVDVGWGESPVAESALPSPEAFAVEVSRRHTGVGSDGLILLDESPEGRPRMRMWNADGSRGKLCLNGLRQAALLAVKSRVEHSLHVVLETDAGLRSAQVSGRTDDAMVTVNAGHPTFARRDIPALGSEPEFWGESLPVASETITAYGVSVGNPHVVTWRRLGSEQTNLPIHVLGPSIQSSKVFPEGVNVHLAEVVSPTEIHFAPWERGSGATQACGTGAVAVFAVAERLNLTKSEALIKMPGGEVQLRRTSQGLELTGEASLVFEGVWLQGRGSAD